MKKKMLKALLTLALALALTLALGSSALCAAAEPDSVTDTPYSGYLITLRPAETSPFSLFSVEPEVPEDLTELDGDNAIYKTPDLDSIRSLVYSGQVAVAEPDYQVELLDVITTPNDPFFTSSTYQYNLRAPETDHGINALAAWDAGLSGTGVTVAVIDSGLNTAHRDAPLNRGPGRYYYYRAYDPAKDSKQKNLFKYTFTDIYGNTYKNDDGTDTLYGYFSSDDVTDTIGHGTFVTGIIAAQTNNGYNIAGMASNVKVIPIRCFTTTENHLGGYTSNMISGLKYAVAQGADVINMSWGIKEFSVSLQNAITAAVSAGCILVAAAGNDGNSSYRYPASFSNVISVGATNRNGTMASYSQRNDRVDVCAPGDYLYSLSSTSNTGTTSGSGTSFSAPQVAAAAVLLREAHPQLTHGDFAALLSANSDLDSITGGHITASGANYAGAGLLNIRKLLDAVGSQIANITPTPNAVSVQACFHPAAALDLTDSSCLVLLAAYNSAGHLVDSAGAQVTASSYGGYQFTHRFEDADIASVQAYFLAADDTLAALLPPILRAVGQS